MAEYIEREALLAEYDRVHVGPPGGARKLIEEAPAADVAPVVYGRWVFGGDGCVVCSECDEEEPNDNHRNYFPNCGARMDGDGK